MWARVDDQFGDHPKIRRAIQIVKAKTGDPNAKSRCKGVWLDLATYAARYLTDGFVPIDLPIDSDTHGEIIAAAFVEAGILAAVEGGYQLHDWGRYNPSSAKVHARREAVKNRVARHRQRQRERRNTVTGVTGVTPSASQAMKSGENRAKEPVFATVEAVFGNGVTNGVGNGVGNNQNARSVYTAPSESGTKAHVSRSNSGNSVTPLVTLPPSPQDQDRQKDHAENGHRGTSEVVSQSEKERIARSAGFVGLDPIGDQPEKPAIEREVPCATNPRTIPRELARKKPKELLTWAEIEERMSDFDRRLTKALIQTGRAYDADSRAFLHTSLEDSAVALARRLSADMGLSPAPSFATLKALAEKVAGFLTAEWEPRVPGRAVRRRAH